MRATTKVFCDKCGKNTANGVFSKNNGVREFHCNECLGKEEDPYEGNFIYRPFKESETLKELLDDDWIINARVELGEEE